MPPRLPFITPEPPDKTSTTTLIQVANCYPGLVRQAAATTKTWKTVNAMPPALLTARVAPGDQQRHSKHAQQER